MEVREALQSDLADLICLVEGSFKSCLTSSSFLEPK